MDSTRILVSVPLYIILPCHPINGSKRHLLLNANLEKVGNSHVRMKVCWTIAQPSLTYQGADEVPTVWNARVPGTTVFIPPNVFASPIYIVVSHLGGQCIHPGLLATIFVTDWYWGATEGIEVETDVHLLSPARIAQSTRLDLQGMDVDDGDVLRRYRSHIRPSTDNAAGRPDEARRSMEADASYYQPSGERESVEGGPSQDMSREVSDDGAVEAEEMLLGGRHSTSETSPSPTEGL